MNQASLDSEMEQLQALARGLTERGRLDEAAELLAVAVRLDPRNDQVKLALADLNEARRQEARPSRKSSVREEVREELRRNAIDAGQFLGLAHLYGEKGFDDQALECLEVARAKDLAGPGQHKLRGRLLLRRHDTGAAAEELERALRLNPFDRYIAESLGRAELARKRLEPALRATIHAFLLLADADEEGGDRLKRRIRTIKRLLGWETADLAPFFHERKELLQTALERLEWHRERFLEDGGWSRVSLSLAAPARRVAEGRIAIAARLRTIKVWSHLSDEQIFRLTQAVEEENFDRGALVFPHKSGGRDLYLIERGEISIQRTTSYGTFVLGVLGSGELFGESSYIADGERSGDAVAVAPSTLLRVDADQLDRQTESHPDVGVQLYWSLWRGLARKLRTTNDQLRSFFDPGAAPENFLRLRRTPQPSRQERLAASDKVRLFREQGLSRHELVTLAAFSQERRFQEGAYVFREGDPGGEMFIVAEGRAMISQILGGGEEALAILGRGDFFGEMAMIEGAPRSADARAHGGPLTVLALDRAAVQEVLTMDAAAALEFLQLLCRLLVNRLREIDEKVIGWRILAGEQPESASA
jgi:CRP-like cAMP-binding protein